MTIDTSSPFMGQLLKRKTVIASGSLILVTGANGYIASHVVNQLLQLGYNVRGTIRAEKPWLEQFFAKKYGEGRFETMLLPAFTKDALEPVLRGVSGVVHLVLHMPLFTSQNHLTFKNRLLMFP